MQTSKSAIFGWLLFDWAAQPVFTLITTFLFAPYFAAFFIGDPVLGQSLWSTATGVAGIAIALLSPVFGAISDSTGRRKPWVFAFSILIIVGGAMLWWAEPAQNGAIRSVDIAVLLILAGYILVVIGAEFATVFTNAMMPSLVPEDRLGRLSGMGWAAGYAGGLVSLFLALILFIPSGETGNTLAGIAPILGLDASMKEGERLIGPFSALWYLVFVIPFFLFTPDGIKSSTQSLKQKLICGLQSLKLSIHKAYGHKPLFWYLLAHMIYIDGLVALFAIGGIYASGVFGWGSTQLGLFGIFILTAGIFGAIVGGRLDDRLGPALVIQASIIMLLVALLGIISIDKTHVLFIIPLSLGWLETIYYILGGLLGLAAGPIQAASRTYLIEVTDEEHRASAFGLFAMAGKATSWAGPLAIGFVTYAYQSQRIGMSVILVFLVVGYLLMRKALSVRG